MVNESCIELALWGITPNSTNNYNYRADAYLPIWDNKSLYIAVFSKK